MRIVVLNAHLGNLGDEAALSAVLQDIRSLAPDASIDVVCNGAADYAGPGWPGIKLHLGEAGDQALKRRSVPLLLAPALLLGRPLWLGEPLERLARLVESADLVVGAPSGLNLGKYADCAFLSRLMLACALRKPVLIYPSSFDRPRRPLFALLVRQVLRRCRVMTREPRSQRFLKGRGIPSQESLDVAFSLPAPAAGDFPPALPRDRAYTVLIPSQLYGWHPDLRRLDPLLVLDELRQLIRREVGLGRRVVLLGHLTGAKREEEFFRSIVEPLAGPEVVQLFPERFEEYQAVIAAAHSVVSMRYHGIVFALKNGVPCLPLAYETKMTEIAALAGLTAHTLPLKDLAPGALVAAKGRLDAVHAPLQARLAGLSGLWPAVARLPRYYLHQELISASARQGEGP